MPDPGDALHIASLDYACTFTTLPPGGGRASFSCPDPVHFTFSFETGETILDPVAGTFEVSWDYSWFGQAEVEAGIAATLNLICAAICTMTSMPLSVVLAAVSVQRVWMFAPNIQGPGVSSGRIATIDAMNYPVTVTDADEAAAADGGEQVTDAA
jgi:hypothetical protein